LSCKINYLYCNGSQVPVQRSGLFSVGYPATSACTYDFSLPYIGGISARSQGPLFL